jgi:hypothetical protein
MDLVDLAHARALADAGMTAALDHADDVEHQWAATAFMWIAKYAREHATFVAEECIAAAVEWGLANPVPKAWGGVFQRARKAEIIKRIGFAPSKNRHLSPTVLWQSNVYKGSVNC